MPKIVLAAPLVQFFTFHLSGRFARFSLKVSCLDKSGVWRIASTWQGVAVELLVARRTITASTGVWSAVTSVHRFVDTEVARLATSRRRSTCTTCSLGRSGNAVHAAGRRCIPAAVMRRSIATTQHRRHCLADGQPMSSHCRTLTIGRV